MIDIATNEILTEEAMLFELPLDATEHEQSEQVSKPAINVGTIERVASGIIGGLLVAGGLRRGKLVGVAMLGAGASLLVRALSGHCSMYAAFGIDTAHKIHPANRSIHLEKSVIINRPAAGIYRFWRNFQNLPLIMRHVKSIEQLSDQRTRWTVSGPMGKSVRWDAEIINDVPNEVIAWTTLPEAEIYNAGSVRFVELAGNQGTEVRVVMDYLPPLGKLGDLFAKMLGDDPAQQMTEDLQRMKAFMEAGDSPSSANAESAWTGTAGSTGAESLGSMRSTGSELL